MGIAQEFQSVALPQASLTAYWPREFIASQVIRVLGLWCASFLPAGSFFLGFVSLRPVCFACAIGYGHPIGSRHPLAVRNPRVCLAEELHRALLREVCMLVFAS